MIVRDEQSLEYVVEQLKKSEVFSFDTETADWGFPNTHITGFSLSWEDGKGAYIPVGHRTGEFQLDANYVYDALRPILQDDSKLIVMHHAQYDIKVAKLMGIKIHDNIFDTMIASWLENTEGDHGLKPLTFQIFGYKMTELSDIAPKEKHPHWKNEKVYRTDLVPIAELGDYAFDDAIWTRRLYFHYLPIIDELYRKVYYELEREFTVCLAEIEAYGAYVNKEKLMQIGKKIEEEMQKAETEIFMCRPAPYTGVPFNINSNQQLNEVLFVECKIPPIGSPGKSGLYSTKADYLEIYAKKGYQIAKAILRYRELEKLYGTYIKGMGGVITDKGRIHCRFNRIGTRTGRLSSSKPNLGVILEVVKRGELLGSPKDDSATA